MSGHIRFDVFYTLQATMLRFAALCFLALLPFTGAQAELVRYAYTDSQGVFKEAPAGTLSINPRDGVRFMLSGGVDRKLRITVKRGSTIVYSATSSKVLGGTDVISYEGKNYYAEDFVGPKLADGSYTIVSDILSSTDQVVLSKSYSVLVDTAAPTPGNFAPKPYSWGNPVLSGDVWKLGVAALEEVAYSSFYLSGIRDANGIESVKVRIYRQSGALHKERDVGFSAENGDATIGYRSGFFPDSNLDETFQVQFVVTDKAGNTSYTKRQKVMFDNIGNEPTKPFGVFDPGVSTTLAPGLKGFVAYKPGDYVKTNPIRLAWKIKKYDWHTYRLGGLTFANSLGEGYVAGEDADHVYVVGSFPYGAENINYIKFINFGAWSGTAGISYNLVLHPAAPKSPVIKSVDYYFSDIGWRYFSGRVVTPQELPVSVSKVRFVVEPRPYTQVASHRGTCTIPPNATSCIIDAVMTLSKGTTGYLHDGTSLTNQENTLRAPGLWADVFWNDQYYPQITHSFDAAEKLLTLRVNQPGEGMHQNALRHRDAWLEDQAGQVLPVSKTKVFHNGAESGYLFDLKTLPEGSHRLVAGARENLGAESRIQLFTFYNDKTKPTVKIHDLASETITSIDQITFSMWDDKDSKAEVASIVLSGGPANDTIALAYRKTGDTTYALEYPILFPSLVEGEKYTVTVKARDEHKNVGVDSKSFIYSPPTTQIVGHQDGKVRVPAAPYTFTRTDGSQVIFSEPLSLADGSVVSGTYELYATLRSDAATSLYVGNKLVAPGATVALAPMNFTSTGGRISLPVRPYEAGKEGDNNLIISTSAPNATIVLANVQTWLPKTSVVKAEKNSFQAMSFQKLNLSVAGSSYCRVTTSAEVARASDPITAPVCLLQWTAVPKGLAEVATPDTELPMTHLQGRYALPGPQVARYNLYVYNADGTRYLVYQGEDTVEVSRAELAAKFAHTLEGKTVRRAVDDVDLRFVQTTSPSCRITGDASVARNNALTGGPLTCLIEVTTMPAGLRLADPSAPSLSGLIMRSGEHAVEWTASVFDNEGAKLTLQQGSSPVTVVEPPVTTSLQFEVNESASASVSPVETFPQSWERKTYTVLAQPQHGSVSATDAGFTYTPEAGYIGPDSFGYRVTDVSGMYAEGEASVSVVQFNYAPSVEPVIITAPRNERSVHELAAADPNLWDKHTFEIASQPVPAGIRVAVRSGKLQIDPVDHWHGTAEFTYRAVDLAGVKSAPAKVVVTVPMGKDELAPVISFDDPSACMAPGSVAKFRLLLEDYDSGINADTVKVLARFRDQTLDMPVTVINAAQVEADQALRVEPRKYMVSPLVAPGSALEARLRAAFYETERNGGRQPFELLVSGADMEGNASVETFTVDPYQIDDRKAPVVSIKAGESGNLMRHLSDLTIVATDDLSGIHADEIVATLAYGDIAAALVFNQVYSATDPFEDACYGRHPLRVEYRSHQSSLLEEDALGVLSEAYIAGEELTLSVVVNDYAGNRGAKTISFGFSPDIHTTEQVSVPAVKYQFHDAAGNPTIRIKAEDVAYAFVPSVKFMAIAAMEGGAPIAINGQRLSPGQPVNLGEVSLLEGQQLSFDIRSDETGKDGEASIMLIPLSNDARTVQIPVHVWGPQIELSSKNWNPVQLFEQASVLASQTDPKGCSLTTYAERSLYSDKMRSPICLFTWEETPPDSYGLPYDPPEMVGFIPEPGTHKIGWSVSFFDGDGQHHVMARGEGSIDVKPAAEVMRFGLGSGLDNSYRLVSDVLGGLQQEAGPLCSVLTTSGELAYDMSALNRPGCLVTWRTLPEGIFPEEWTDLPKFGGVFDQLEGDASFAWSISSYSTSGEEVQIMEGQQVVPLQDPPTPSISVEKTKLLSGSLYRAPMKGGLVGDFTVEAINARLRIEVKEDGKVIESDETTGGLAGKQIYRGRILATEKPLWSRTPVEIASRYTGFPEVNAKAEIEILAVPDESLRPEIEVAQTSVLNTDGLSVSTWITNPFEQEAYSEDRMGQWEVRLLNYLSFTNQAPLTGFKPVDGEGRTAFDLDLLALKSSFIRVMPEARLVSPVPEYQRTVMGARPLYITILRGEAIGSSIDARRIKGEAPLSFMGKLDLAERLDYKSLGDVIWEVRESGSGAWEAVDNNSSMTDRIQHIFDAGLYELRARVFNRHSGAEFTTETLEIHAYNVPQIKISGPANAFIGSDAKLRVDATIAGNTVAERDLIVEWSEDNGETWAPGSTEYVVRRDVEERVMMMSRVRMTGSPEDWADAYVERRHRVAFRPVNAPRGSILGSKVLEKGKAVNWRGNARAPYPRMDVTIKGRFILPDGSVVDSSEVEYMPTEEDAKKERVEVSYEAWIEGFEDAGARSTVTRRVSVWQYEWPEWSMNVRASATQAPAEIDLRIRKPVGMGRYLEDVQYEWEIPAGVEVTAARTEDSRALLIREPGHYPVKVRITDARGNFTELVEELKIDVPDPWAVDFRMSMSNSDNRAPLDVRLSPNVSGGHPRDRINQYRYLLNGEMVTEGVRYSSVVLDEGKHELTLEIESAFGSVASSSRMIEVMPNTPPVCELEARESRSHWRFFANCIDETGSVRKHVWKVNGEELGLSGSRISVSAREDSVLEVSLMAIDDGGAESNVVLWHGSVSGSSVAQ